MNAYQLILASASPRRRELLERCGLHFEVRPADVEERLPENILPQNAAEFLAWTKASYFAKKLREHELLITADTVVVQGQHILGKPANRQEAVEVLGQLSGGVHSVITGVYLLSAGFSESFSVETLVHFRQLEEEEIAHYVDHYQPYDKAGAYGIQEWIGLVGVEKVQGCYYNVMGLPVQELYQRLKRYL